MLLILITLGIRWRTRLGELGMLGRCCSAAAAAAKGGVSGGGGGDKERRARPSWVVRNPKRLLPVSDPDVCEEVQMQSPPGASMD